MTKRKEEADKKPFQMPKFPTAVYFMFGNEFCERFSYYGMRAILTLYLLNIHKLPENTVLAIYHSFTMLCYFTPILGSLLADGFFGRFRVILVGSIVYCCGHVLITVGAIPNFEGTAGRALDYSGLFVIAVATGCIKPCVSAFAADQFPPEQTRQRESFFSAFYFMINLGSFLSIIVTPILKTQVRCLGQNHCFPLAFGVPAVLMVLATLFFISGKVFYRIPPKADNVIGKVFGLISYSIRMRLRGKLPNKPNLLHYATDRYDKDLIEGVWRVGKICLLFIPVVFFWALFDQQGGSWIIQANEMNGKVGRLTILPEQMSTINPLLVILLVPVFELLIYPLCLRVRLLTTPLQKMGCGGVLAAFAFVIVGFIQLAVDKTAVSLPAPNHHRVVIINLSNDTVDVNGNTNISGTVTPLNFTLNPGNQNTFDTHMSPEIFGKAVANLAQMPRNEGLLVVVYSQNDFSVTTSDLPFKLAKIPEGLSQLLIMSRSNQSVLVANDKETYQSHKVNDSFKPISIQPSLLSDPEYVVSCKLSNGQIRKLGAVTPGMGGVYGLIITEVDEIPTKVATVVLVEANSVSILWQIFPYVVITIGEIMFSITGLEFSYSQAPASMKSILQALWLLTVAFGNLIDIIISGSHFIESKPGEFFLYASLMAVTIVIFGILACFYQYADDENDSVDDSLPGQSYSTNISKEELLLETSKINGHRSDPHYKAT